MYMWLFFENNNNDYNWLYSDDINIRFVDNIWNIISIIIDNSTLVVNINVDKNNSNNSINSNIIFFINESTILYNDVR